PRVLEPAREHDVTVEPGLPRCDLRERHPHLERDPGLLGQHAHRPDRADGRNDLAVDRPDRLRLAAEVVRERVPGPARVRLIAVREPAAARRTTPAPRHNNARMIRLLAAALLLLALPPPRTPPPGPVDSPSALQARIDAARPGDVILVRDGTYTTAAPIAVRAKGRAGAPIRIVAETPGGVTLAGSDGFDVAGDAAYVEIDG